MRAGSPRAGEGRILRGLVSTAAARTDEVFAANRARARIELTVAAASGATRRIRVLEQGSLRVRFPHVTGSELEAILVNTAGGMAGGDQFDIDIAAGEGARLLVGTTAAEKIYRSTGPATKVAVRLAASAGATLRWLPQESILFDRACLDRRIDVDLDDGATLVLAEAVVLGRSAMGESVEQGELIDRWRVRVGGRLVMAESVRLTGAIAAKLSERAVAASGCAFATVLIVPGKERHVEAVRALDVSGEVGVSAWNGIAVARLVAADGVALRRDLAAVLSAFDTGPLPRLWVN
jgi:urease accessory protein